MLIRLIINLQKKEFIKENNISVRGYTLYIILAFLTRDFQKTVKFNMFYY